MGLTDGNQAQIPYRPTGRSTSLYAVGKIQKTMKGVKEMMELIIEHSKNTKREIMLQPELSAKLIHGH